MSMRATIVPKIGLLFAIGFIQLACAGESWAESPGDSPKPAAQSDNGSTNSSAAADQNQPTSWPEGSVVKGRVVDHEGNPVAGAEVLLLGKERIAVDPKRTLNPFRPLWYLVDAKQGKPSSTKTNLKGEFELERKEGTANRIAVIANDPLLWEVKRADFQLEGDLEIKLPQSGGIAIHCDLPGKPAKQYFGLELRAFNDIGWNIDMLHYNDVQYSVANPGDTVIEHLPPGTYAIRRDAQTPMTGINVLTTMCDQRIVKVDPNQRPAVSFDRKVGRPLKGQVHGLENVELAYAYVQIHYFGPDEVPGPNGKPIREATGFDVIPITAQGDFHSDFHPAWKILGGSQCRSGRWFQPIHSPS